ncbi:hypothetical protein AB6T38_10455 [Aliiglaciecola sp. SL4]|uniref:hypothetical protein n=1 Tax=Aliiglaciecola sp. SL4 TaxID=3239806 RepID=UPI00355C4608
MTDNRPLIKHIKNHDALFTDLALIRNAHAAQLGFGEYGYHKTPKFISPDGQRQCIEPERSIVLPNLSTLKGVKTILTEVLPGLCLVAKSDLGFRYPTAALAGFDAPFIKRFRSEYFHRVGEDRNICRPTNLSYGIKSRGKGDNRQEYEIWVPDDQLQQDPLPLFIDKYGEDLPDDVRDFATKTPIVHGWMGVKRAAFEALYHDPQVTGDLVICLGFSVDVYNIGARPDLSFSHELQSSIAVSNVELEWEIMGYYAPSNHPFDHDVVWQAINNSLSAIGDPIAEVYAEQVIPIQESKTERILSTIRAQGISSEQIASMNLKPWEFLQTASSHRRKPKDPSRSINLLGRLNRLFYQSERKLPSLRYIHDLIAE